MPLVEFSEKMREREYILCAVCGAASNGSGVKFEFSRCRGMRDDILGIYYGVGIGLEIFF